MIKDYQMSNFYQHAHEYGSQRYCKNSHAQKHRNIPMLHGTAWKLMRQNTHPHTQLVNTEHCKK